VSDAIVLADSAGPDVQWTRERIDLVKKTVCPQGIGDAAFALFVEQCKRSGLDPLIKEAFCVKRRVNIGDRERPNWIEKFEFQPAESGFLARAERMPDFRGIYAAAVHAEDSCAIDAAAGVVAHTFSPGKRRGELLGAWARLERAGRAPLVVWLDVGGYQQSGSMWAKIGPTMIEKCARVAALRKGYPSAFGALYIPEELPEDGEAHASTALPATVAAAQERLVATLAKSKALPAQTQVAAPVAQPKGELVEVTPRPAPAPEVMLDAAAGKVRWAKVLELGAAAHLSEKEAGAKFVALTGKKVKAAITDLDVAKFASWLDDAPAEEGVVQ
jgi:phage recombination protein Bet